MSSIKMCAVDCGRYYQNSQIKEDKADWANITYEAQDKYINILVKNPKERGHFECLSLS